MSVHHWCQLQLWTSSEATECVCTVKQTHKQHTRPQHYSSHKHTHTRLMALCPGLPGWASTRKVKPRDSEWQWHQLSRMQICISLQTITMTAAHHSVFYRLDALPAAQPTASKHWRHMQVCTSLQTDNHASSPPLSFLQAGCPSWRPTNCIKALKGLNRMFK